MSERDTEPTDDQYAIEPVSEPVADPVASRASDVSRHEHRRLEIREEDREDVVRQAYRVPLLLIAGGTSVLFVVTSLGLGVVAGIVTLLTYAISVPIGVFVFWMCTILWIGNDAPMRLSALRLAGVYAAASAAGLIPFVGWFASLATFVGLMSELLDLDLTDALLVGILTFLTHIILFMYVPLLLG